MDRAAFEEVVRDAIESLPERFHHTLENVAIVVEEEPDRAELNELGLNPAHDELFGVYQGISLLERGASHTGLPDRIVIYRRPILRSCDTVEAMKKEIRHTVIHELGHHMGLGDDQMPF